MAKSPVAGVAGSVRIQRLSAVAFAAAEAHGKRLDHNGKMRAINDLPPLTTTGLHLNELYQAHAKDTMRSKSKTKALHAIIQFPAQLINHSDKQNMLNYARKFMQIIFGENAIFADRMDQDEKSQHVVDIFLAPKYTKETKHKRQLAISTSKHLKILANNYKRPITLWGQGQALQDAFFNYLRDDIRVHNVQRGAKKKTRTPDWLSPEELAYEAKIETQKNEIKKLQQGRKLLEEKIETINITLQKWQHMNDEMAKLYKIAQLNKSLEQIQLEAEKKHHTKRW